MQDISLHILDIVENAVRAEAKRIEISIEENCVANSLSVSVKDDGAGMEEAMLAKARDPFFTTKQGKKFGIGISLLAMAAEQTGGSLEVKSEKGKGSEIKAVFKIDHPDMKPMGNIFETLTAVIAGNQEIRFVYNFNKGDQRIHFDSFDLNG